MYSGFETLLGIGVATSVVFVAVLLIEGVLRPGYDPTYHTGSELSLSDRGWIQVANFLQMRVGMFAFAVGVHRTLNTPVGAGLLAIFGLGMIAAGVFRPDPIRGYPSGAPSETPDKVSWQHQVHGVVGGPVAFLAIFGGCLTLATLSDGLDGSWRTRRSLRFLASLSRFGQPLRIKGTLPTPDSYNAP